MRSEIEMLRRELAACRNELDKWQAAHTDVDLEEMRLQAQQPSLAAKQAYINALRWHVAASEARERELREAVIQFDESCEICEDESINYAWAEGDPVLLAVLRSVLQAQPPHAALDALLAEKDREIAAGQARERAVIGIVTDECHECFREEVTMTQAVCATRASRDGRQVDENECGRVGRAVSGP